MVSDCVLPLQRHQTQTHLVLTPGVHVRACLFKGLPDVCCSYGGGSEADRNLRNKRFFLSVVNKAAAGTATPGGGWVLARPQVSCWARQGRLTRFSSHHAALECERSGDEKKAGGTHRGPPPGPWTASAQHLLPLLVRLLQVSLVNTRSPCVSPNSP